MRYIFLIMLLVVCSCSNGGNNEIFIIPKNHVGYIILIYNQPTGSIPKYKDGKRVYEIPSNGILTTQFAANEKWHNVPEFYYEEIRPDNKIAFTTNSEYVPQDAIVASGGISGSANKDLAGKNRVEYVVYYVGNKIQTDSAYAKVERLDIASFGE